MISLWQNDLHAGKEICVGKIIHPDMHPNLIASMISGEFPQPILISNPFSKEEYSRLFCNFERLLIDPEHDKWKLGTKNDDGLHRRDKTKNNPTADPKWIFHYKPVKFWELANKNGLNTESHAIFLKRIMFILSRAKRFVRPIITALDTIMPGYALTKNFDAGIHCLRLIRDDPPAETGDLVVATEHQDFSFCSLHLWESRPGFAYFDDKRNKWKALDHKSSALFFLGKKSTLMTGGRRKINFSGSKSREIDPNSGILRPLTHMVREIGNPADLVTPRYAVVVFFHTPLIL